MRLNLYGLLIALGVLAAVIYMGREAKRLSLPDDLAVDLALWSVPIAVVFARLYYVAFALDTYRGDWLGILRFWEGGLAIYGGIIGGTLGVFLLSRRRKLHFLQLMDLMAPAVILGQAIGRWGNFFNGEAFGFTVSQPGWQFFPIAVFVDGQWHLATFFYESLWNILGFLVLLRLRKRCYEAGYGFVLLCYLLWYALGRMVIEGLRTDSLMLGSLRVSQVLSVALIAIAGFLLLYRMQHILPRLWILMAGLLLLVPVLLGAPAFLIPAYLALAAFVFSALWLFWPKPGEGIKA